MIHTFSKLLHFLFLISIGWAAIGDEPYHIERSKASYRKFLSHIAPEKIASEKSAVIKKFKKNAKNILAAEMQKEYSKNNSIHLGVFYIEFLSSLAKETHSLRYFDKINRPVVKVRFGSLC